MVRKSEHHRRVIPEPEIPRLCLQEIIIEQRTQCGLVLFLR